MNSQKPLQRVALFVLLQITLWACSGLRTEMYRAETSFRYKEACRLYKQGDYQAARSGLEVVITLDPAYGPAHAALGNLDLIGEDYPNALAHYQRAVAVDPELETALQPLIMVADAHQAREPLHKAGVGLARVYPLIMEGRWTELQVLLDKDFPLLLLANDTMGITPGKRGELQRKISLVADSFDGSVRCRLFFGYLLFSGHTNDSLAMAMLHRAVAEATNRDRQEALVVLGQLYERQGEANTAVDTYLVAVEAGRPITEVAHHLARVYRVDIASVLSPNERPAEGVLPPEPMHIEILTDIPPAPALELGSLTDAKEIPITSRPGARYTF